MSQKPIKKDLEKSCEPVIEQYKKLIDSSFFTCRQAILNSLRKGKISFYSAKYQKYPEYSLVIDSTTQLDVDCKYLIRSYEYL